MTCSFLTSSLLEFFCNVTFVLSWLEEEVTVVVALEEPEVGVLEELLELEELELLELLDEDELPLLSEAILASVLLPAMPSAERPLAFWKLKTASLVSVPKLPVTEPV